MVIVWTVVAASVVIATLLVVLEVQNVRRRRSLEGLEPVDPRIGERAVVDAESAHAITEGTARAAHPGLGGVGGTLGGS
jgi:hypothetical protein